GGRVRRRTTALPATLPTCDISHGITRRSRAGPVAAMPRAILGDTEMQLGFVSAIFPELSLDDVARFAAESGYKCVEVMCWPAGKAERRYAGVTHVDVNDYDPDAVLGTVQKHGITISGLGYYPNPLAPDQAEADTYVAHIRKVISAAARLKVNVMNTFI